MIRWSIAVSGSIIFLGLAIWLAAAWLCWSNWRRNGRKKSVAFLESLRLLLITLLIITLARPEFVYPVERNELPEVVVMMDASGSMQSKDVPQATNLLSRAQWLQSAKESEFWKPLEKSARVVVEEFSPMPGTNGPGGAAVAGSASSEAVPAVIGTDLNSALEAVLKRQRNLKAVLLLSDGDWNLGASPVGVATRYREQGVPVFSVAVGQEAPLPDLVLEKVSAPAYGLFGEQISIHFKIQSHLPREVKTKISLLDGTRSETEKEITVPAYGSLADAILWSPRQVGERTLALKLPVESDESLADNNEHEFRIAVRLEKLKVLVVDSLPRWEYRYLRNALERDPGVEMNCILFHPGMAPGAGRHYLPAFPGTKEALSPYDVIFLGDVGLGQNELTEQDAELIKGLVEQQASGLVLLPGRRGRQLTLLESPLGELFPVVIDSAQPSGVGLQNEASLQLSTSGRRHWLTRFETDENQNQQIWDVLPGFFWSAAVEKSRPGSEVLGVHESLRNSWGRIPLLVTRPHGSGKVLFMGTDSAWRWRRGVEDRFHYRFWSQVVRWMAHQRHLSEKEGIRLSYSPEAPRLGDTLFLQTTVLDALGSPIEQGPVAGRITAPSGTTEHLSFAALEGGWGVFKAQFTPQEGGLHKITVEAAKHGRQLDTEIVIDQPQIEKLGQPANYEILREISDISAGASGTIDSVSELVDKISLLPEAKPIERRVRIWCDPWWGGLLVSLLAVYWTGRKLAGMI